MYVIFSKLTDKGARTLFENPDRLLEVNRELEEMGVKVVKQFFVMGDYDFMTIVEAPDQKTLSAALVNILMRGTVHTITYQIMPVEELVEELKRRKIWEKLTEPL